MSVPEMPSGENRDWQQDEFLTSQFQTSAAFLLCLAAGVLGSLAGHAKGNPQLSILGPVLAMGAYLGITWLRDPLRVGTRSFGDSFYYLGFLFTLIALAITLLSFAQTGLQNGKADSVRQIFTIFGMAVITTVVGLLGRVTMVNLRKSPEEEQQTLQAAAQKSHEVATRQIAELAKLLRETSKAAKAVQQTREEFTHQAGKFQAQNQEQMLLLHSRIQQHAEDTRKGAEAARSSTKAIQRETAEILNQNDAAISRSVRLLNATSDNLSVSIMEASKAIQSAAAGMQLARIAARKELEQMQESRAYPLLWKFAVANTVLLTLLTLILGAALLNP